MSALLTLRNVFWAATTLCELVLIIYLIRGRLLRSYFWLFLYLCCTVLQSVLGVITYSLLNDFRGAATRNIIWSSQAVVLTMRFSAVCEMARRILARYSGISALAQRLLLVVAAVVLLYTAVFSDERLSMMILTVDRGAELAIAAFIVGLLLFARYYLLEISPLDRAL